MTIKYQKKFPYAPYLNEDIGFEKTIDDRCTKEEILEALSELKQMAEEFHKQSLPPLEQMGVEERIISLPRVPPEIPNVHEQPKPPFVHDILPSKKMTKEERVLATIEDINTCQEIKVLESYRLIAKTDQRLTEAYQTKLNSFQKETA